MLWPAIKTDRGETNDAREQWCTYWIGGARKETTRRIGSNHSLPVVGSDGSAEFEEKVKHAATSALTFKTFS
jgi:hypothetical protein